MKKNNKKKRKYEQLEQNQTTVTQYFDITQPRKRVKINNLIKQQHSIENENINNEQKQELNEKENNLNELISFKPGDDENDNSEDESKDR